MADEGFSSLGFTAQELSGLIAEIDSVMTRLGYLKRHNWQERNDLMRRLRKFIIAERERMISPDNSSAH